MRDKEFACKHPAQGPTTSLGGKCKDCPPTCFKSKVQAAPNVTPTAEPTWAIPLSAKHIVGAPSNCDGWAVTFNPSVIEWQGGYLFTWRHGWRGCEIWACKLGTDFRQLTRPFRLDLIQETATTGCEDARLFRVNGRLHVWYTGVGRVGRSVRTSVCVARLDEATLRTEARWTPTFPGRPRWEKNWSFFGHGDALYCIYECSPHRVFRVESDKIPYCHLTKWSPGWLGGYIRGGASPVLHDGEYYHFFHGYDTVAGMRRYNWGVYTFEPRPPFRPLRVTRHPVQIAPKATDTADNCHGVVFPGGAIRSGDGWLLAVGVHDRSSELRWFSDHDIEARLSRVE